MSSSSRKYVCDASVLIDLLNAELLGLLVKLSGVFLITDFISNEITGNDQKDTFDEFIDSDEVQIVSSDSSDVVSMQTHCVTCNELSVADASCYVVAEKQHAVVLSGDGPLRKYCKQNNREVHGTLWIMDQLVGHDYVLKKSACSALEQILLHGARLPHAECERRRHQWGA